MSTQDKSTLYLYSDKIDYVVKVVIQEARDEEKLAYQLVITILSAYSNNPINLLINAPSGVGKNYIINKVAALFPQLDILMLAGMTDKALFHRKGLLVVKNPETQEYESIEPELQDKETEIYEIEKEIAQTNDRSQKQDLRYKIKELESEKRKLLKDAKKLIDLSNKVLIFLDTPPERLLTGLLPLLSHDQYEVEYEYTDTHNGIKTQTNVLRGWPVVIIAQAIDYSNSPRFPEYQRRFITANPTMTPKKYQNAIDYTSNKYSIPDLIYQHTVLSDEEKDKAKEFIKELKQQILAISRTLKPGKNNTLIPFVDLIKHSLPKEKSGDMTRANRLYTYLSFLPTVYFDKRPRLEISKEGEEVDLLSSQLTTIATFEDLQQTVYLMEYADGVRPYILEWYYDVFLEAYDSKTEKDSKTDSKGNVKEEERIATTTKDLVNKHKEKHNETLRGEKILKEYLYPLMNQGYVDSIPSVVDARANIYFPIIETKKYIDLFPSEKRNNLLQQKQKIVINSITFPSKQYIISKIGPILRYYSEIGYLAKIKNHLDEEITLEQLVDGYFGNPEDYFEIDNNKKNESTKEQTEEQEPKSDSNNNIKNNLSKSGSGEQYRTDGQILDKSQGNTENDINITTNPEEQSKKLFPEAKNNKSIYSESQKQDKSIVYKCYYCPAGFETSEEHLKHSVNAHPGKPAQPTKALIEQIKNQWVYEDSNDRDSKDYASPKDYENLEEKGNPWEVDDGETVTQEEIDKANLELLDDLEHTYNDTVEEEGKETIG